MRELLLTSDGIFDYFSKVVRSTTLFGLARRTLRYFNRFTLIGRIFRWLTLAVRIIEKSAVLILAATLVLILLPIAALTAIILLVIDNIAASRAIRRISMPEGEIYVLFSIGDYGVRFARSLPGEVYIVRRFAFLRKSDSPRVHIISRSLFIRLRRRYFDAIPERMTYLF